MKNQNTKEISMKTAGFLVLIFVFSLASCQKNEEFIGYNDIINDSPKLLWGSSVDELKNKYPNVVENMNIGTLVGFYDDKTNGQITYRSFQFINNKLFMINVSYGNYTSEMLELLKKDIEEKYGKITIEDNGTIETWFIEINKNNEIVIVINKIENNVVNCSYIFPSLRDEYSKITNNIF